MIVVIVDLLVAACGLVINFCPGIILFVVVVLGIATTVDWLSYILTTKPKDTPALESAPKIEDFKDYFKWREAVEDYEARLAREKAEAYVSPQTSIGYNTQRRIEEQEQRDWQAAQTKKVEDSWAAREFQREQREKRNARYRKD